MAANNLPVLTRTYDLADDFRPESGCVYISGRSVEERSEHIARWRNNVQDVVFVDLIGERQDAIEISIADGKPEVIRLRSSRELGNLWQFVGNRRAYLDITGLKHSSWSALLKAAVAARADVTAVYLEPDDYRMSPQPTENEIYDLSERIEGIAPLPGFARLTDMDAKSCFVPLLGFEGTRLLFLLSQLEPPGHKIFPVVGVPGYRAEYPFTAYLSNRLALHDTQAWQKVRFAAADCPFDIINVLSELSQAFPQDILKIAPIGTKPHALGAVLFAITNSRTVELVYDHPVRKAKRTIGISRLHTYFVSSIWK